VSCQQLPLLMSASRQLLSVLLVLLLLLAFLLLGELLLGLLLLLLGPSPPYPVSW